MEMTNISILPAKQCTGCGSCYNCCPVDAISMQKDNHGFLYPTICLDKCISCAQCAQVCPVLTFRPLPTEQKVPECYAAWSNDKNIRFHSTSGGIFTHLAEMILAQNGLVAGAQYRPDHLVEHALIDSKEYIPNLRQSKYIPSDTGLIYRQVEKSLKKGLPVLFTGTPCQCAGLQGYLQTSYDNLYLCDFICRGVNSPTVYLAYLKELEERYHSPVKQVWFKNKTYGWNNFCTKITFENGAEYLADRETDPFMLGYLKSKLSRNMRPSCYHCSFKGIYRPVDFTLGDFWGIEKYDPTIATEYGVSVILCHSSKGDTFLRSIANKITLKKSPIQAAAAHNKCLTHSVSHLNN